MLKGLKVGDIVVFEDGHKEKVEHYPVVGKEDGKILINGYHYYLDGTWAEELTPPQNIVKIN
jgi:signal peptidase I